MIKIVTSCVFINEKKYVFDFIFREILGTNYFIIFTKKNGNNITKLILENGKIIFVKDIFFAIEEDLWLTSNNFPRKEIIKVKTPLILEKYIFDEYIPLLFIPRNFKSNDNWFFINKNNIIIKVDIFGSVFFMLSRYEEFVSFKPDRHERYDSKHSIIIKNNLNLYPIVDTYISILKYFLKSKDPSLFFKKNKFNVNLSIDFDRPFCYINTKVNIKTFLWFIKNKNFISSLEFLYYYLVKIIFRRDIYIICLKKQLDKAKKFKFSVQVFVMNAKKDTHDSGYNPKNTTILKILNYALKSGHSIGFHPSYNTFTDSCLYHEEKMGLESKLKIKIVSNRQHYLKMKIPYTWRQYDYNNIEQDHSIGYHDNIGFRAGTSYRFRLYDLIQRKKLIVYENPLIIMDSGLLKCQNKREFNLIFNNVLKIIDICKYYDGNFSFLWHNSSFNFEWRKWRSIYTLVLKYCNYIKN